MGINQTNELREFVCVCVYVNQKLLTVPNLENTNMATNLTEIGIDSLNDQLCSLQKAVDWEYCRISSANLLVGIKGSYLLY